jgi:hypothetical protein
MPAYQPRVIDPVIRPGYNNSGSTILKGSCVRKATSPTLPEQIVLATAATDLIYGVAMNDILTGTFGDVQVGGIAIVLAGASITAPIEVTAGASGKAVAGASGDVLLGLAQTNGVNNDYMEVELTLGGTVD